MSDGEIKTLETDVIIFPMKFRNENEGKFSDESEKTDAPEKQAQTQSNTNQRINVFARLKKSVRKKSSSIL